VPFGGDPNIILLRIVFLIPALLIGFVLHEMAHAYVAVAFGDNTPRNQGRLNPDPRRHLDPLGTVMVLLAGVGFAKPVQINPSALRTTANKLMVALAGPAANLAVAVVVSFPLKLMATQGFGTPVWNVDCSLTASPTTILTTELFYIYSLNLLLAVFNLLPLPPLDGFELVRAFLRNSNPRLLFNIEMNRQGILLVFFVIVLFARDFLLSILNVVIGPVTTLLGVPLGRPCG
jgi:Zn-dependent protease